MLPLHPVAFSMRTAHRTTADFEHLEDSYMDDSNNLYSNENYIETGYIRNITHKAIMYLNNGFPVHLRGSAGVGKTALAFHIANKIGKPILFISGSEEVTDENLVGGYLGLRKFFVEDNFITSVYKKEERIKKAWSDGRLLVACREGYTVIYDEFTRAKPETNNVLLPILEERIIDLPYNNGSDTYMKIHPEFKIIFTSNPEEYVGVYHSPNALIDRMITIDMDSIDEDTEKAIIMAKSGIGSHDAEKIVLLTRLIKSKTGDKGYASLRSSIMLAKIAYQAKLKMIPSNPLFRQVCNDVYNSAGITLGIKNEKMKEMHLTIDSAIDTVFAAAGRVLQN